MAAHYSPQFFALFCTSQAATPALIEDLQSQEPIDAAIDSRGAESNPWVIVSSPDQTTFAKPPSSRSVPPPPAPAAAFTGASLDTLGAFVAQRFVPTPTDTAPISHDAFCVLDERSAADHSLLVVKWQAWREGGGPGEDPAADASLVQGWVTLRVAFRGAAFFVRGLAERDLRFCKDELEMDAEVEGMAGDVYDVAAILDS